LSTGNEEDAQRIFVLTDEEDGRVLHLKADSVQEKLEWMQAIAKQIDTRTSARHHHAPLQPRCGVWQYSTHLACASFTNDVEQTGQEGRDGKQQQRTTTF
jgi:GTPase